MLSASLSLGVKYVRKERIPVRGLKRFVRSLMLRESRSVRKERIPVRGLKRAMNSDTGLTFLTFMSEKNESP